MKKVILCIATTLFILSCNPNPSATGDSIIMEHEKKTNAIEWQEEQSDTMYQQMHQMPDSTVTKDSVSKNSGE